MYTQKINYVQKIVYILYTTCIQNVYKMYTKCTQKTYIVNTTQLKYNQIYSH